MRRPSVPRIFWAFIRRDAKIRTAYKWGFLFNFLGILSGSASFFFVSKLIHPEAGSALASYGGNYFSFVLIGLAFARYQGIGMDGFLGGLQRERNVGTLEILLASPVPLPVSLLGSTLWDFLEATGEVLVYGFLGFWLFGVQFSWRGLPWGLVTLVLAYAAFMALGLLAAACILVLRRGNPVAWAFGELSQVLGGVYFPLALLPLGLQKIAFCLPMTHALEGLRLALLKGAGPSILWPHWLALAIFGVVLFPIGLAAFQWAVRRCRRDGSLGHF